MLPAKSIDGVWICSFKCYTFWKNCWYKLLSLPCAICIATYYGCEMAATAFFHVWFCMPFVNLFHLTCYHCLGRMTRQCFRCLLGPIFSSLGGLFGAFRNTKDIVLPIQQRATRQNRQKVNFDENVKTKRIPKIGKTPARLANTKVLVSPRSVNRKWTRRCFQHSTVYL